jgi:type II protein arginine methyltransferase
VLVGDVLGQPGTDNDEGEPAPEESVRREALRELVPRWHFAMLNDILRNSLFEEAIEATVRPGDHVLDIGGGSGLLAMIAARHGAGRVTSCEIVPPIARAAELIVANNGLADTVHIVNKRSTELVLGQDLPRPADVVVTEIVDCGLVGEGIIPTVRHAREHLLRPGGIIVPGSARLMAVPIDSAAMWQLNQVDYACGFDVSHFNEFATAGYFQVRLGAWPHRTLAAPQEVLSVDFLNDPLRSGEFVAEIAVERTGTCHGIAFWFELMLDEKRVLSNEPGNATSHWHQAFQCFPQPLTATAGSALRLRVAHSDNLIHFTPAGPGPAYLSEPWSTR